MSQVNYDLIEFIVLNRDELKTLLTKEVEHLMICSHVFVGNRDIFNELLLNKKINVLRQYIKEHFPETDYENIYLTINKDCVNIIENKGEIYECN